MSAKNSKNKKQTLPDDDKRRQRVAQILFAMLAVLLILSMVLSATVSY